MWSSTVLGFASLLTIPAWNRGIHTSRYLPRSTWISCGLLSGWPLRRFGQELRVRTATSWGFFRITTIRSAAVLLRVKRRSWKKLEKNSNTPHSLFILSFRRLTAEPEFYTVFAFCTVCSPTVLCIMTWNLTQATQGRIRYRRHGCGSFHNWNSQREENIWRLWEVNEVKQQKKSNCSRITRLDVQKSSHDQPSNCTEKCFHDYHWQSPETRLQQKSLVRAELDFLPSPHILTTLLNSVLYCVN